MPKCNSICVVESINCPCESTTVCTAEATLNQIAKGIRGVIACMLTRSEERYGLSMQVQQIGRMLFCSRQLSATSICWIEWQSDALLCYPVGARARLYDLYCAHILTHYTVLRPVLLPC
jgi:hypothetical protein